MVARSNTPFVYRVHTRAQRRMSAQQAQPLHIFSIATMHIHMENVDANM